jgi:hypothetical protein
MEAQADRKKLDGTTADAEAEVGRMAPGGVTILEGPGDGTDGDEEAAAGGEGFDDDGLEGGNTEDNDEGVQDAGGSPLVLPEGAKISGGGRPGDEQIQGLGRWWNVVVVDVKNPDAHDIIPITLSSGTPGCSYIKQIRCNEVVAMPERVIRSLETGTKMVTKQRISPRSRFYGNEAAALAANPGSTVEYDGNGQMFLKFVKNRYVVERQELLGGPPKAHIPRRPRNLVR